MILDKFVIIWFSVAIVFGIIEALTSGLTSIWFCGGALAAGLLAFVSHSVWLQITVFIIVSGVLLLVTRPLASKYFNNKTVATNIEAIIGAKGQSLGDFGQGQNGQVRVDNKVWTATSNESINKGDNIQVISIKGVTLNVNKYKEEI